MDDYGNAVMTPDRFVALEQEVRNHSGELSRIALVLESLGANQAKMLQMFEEHVRISERQHAMSDRIRGIEDAHRREMKELYAEIRRVEKDTKVDWVRWTPVILMALGFLGVGAKMTVGG